MNLAARAMMPALVLGIFVFAPRVALAQQGSIPARVGYTMQVTGRAFLGRNHKQYEIPSGARWNVYVGDEISCEPGGFIMLQRFDGGDKGNEFVDYKVMHKEVLDLKHPANTVPFDELDGGKFRIMGRFGINEHPRRPEASPPAPASAR